MSYRKSEIYRCDSCDEPISDRDRVTISWHVPMAATYEGNRSAFDLCRKCMVPVWPLISDRKAFKNAIAAALKADDEVANGPWRYMVIGEADQNVSRNFIHRSCCIEEAERHGAMQLSAHCEIVVIDKDKNSVWNSLFRFGKKVVD